MIIEIQIIKKEENWIEFFIGIYNFKDLRIIAIPSMSLGWGWQESSKFYQSRMLINITKQQILQIVISKFLRHNHKASFQISIQYYKGSLGNHTFWFSHYTQHLRPAQFSSLTIISLNLEKNIRKKLHIITFSNDKNHSIYLFKRHKIVSVFSILTSQ